MGYRVNRRDMLAIVVKRVVNWCPGYARRSGINTTREYLEIDFFRVLFNIILYQVVIKYISPVDYHGAI